MEKEEIVAMADSIWDPIFNMIGEFISDALSSVLFFLVFVLVVFLISCRINPFRLTPEHLKSLKMKFLPYDLFRWMLYDLLTMKQRANRFKLFGFTIFCGRQGSGKSTSMVEYLVQQHALHPKALIVTNFACSVATHRMTDWRDFLNIRNGEDGVIFAIDEIHSEFSSASSNDFPESILSEISQQRKQRVKIVATAQTYSRVSKPIREQAFSVILCHSYFGRLTTNREYDAAEFATTGDSSYSLRKGVRSIWRHKFIQSDELRNCFDTYEKIERMKGLEFLPRKERG